MSLRLAERVEPLFLRAVELGADQQGSFVDEHCGDDAELKLELCSLLQADAEIRQTWSGLCSEAPPEQHWPTGLDIPGYTLVGPLGQGGMGSVFLALGQEPPFEGARFAIKTLHAHRTTPLGRQRFAAEQRALAKLDHRFIARLYGSGELPDGRPYLVMEHIEGLSLDRHCRRGRLTIEDRLRLFCKICSAVHYAHQNLIVHRDLKPSNILISADGLPHLVDFGIAKRLQAEDSDSDPLTRWLAPLTPAFASPEQQAGDEITTASDIYSLGRLLLYLLTDSLPSFKQPAADVSPSLLASLLTQENAEITAWLRRTEPKKLTRQLAGDLGYIAAKSLRIQPGERYASAQELSDDIVRYVEGSPVTARKGTWRYYLARYCMRHRFALWSIASTLLAIGLALAGWRQTQQVHRLEERGLASMSLLRESVGLPEDLFLESDAVELTLSEVLDLDLPEADRQLLVEVTKRLYKPDIEILRQMQDYLGRAASESGKSLPVSTARGLASVSLRLGRLMSKRGHFEQATAVLRDSLDLAETAGVTGSSLAAHLENLSEVLHGQDLFAEATVLIRRALDLRRQAIASEGETSLIPALSQLGTLLYAQGFYDASEDAFRQGLELLDRDDPALAQTRSEFLSGLSVAIMETGRFEAAETAIRESLDTLGGVLGPRHILTLQVRHNLVAVLGRAGKFHEAIEIAVSNLMIAEDVLGKDHPRLAHIVLSLAAAHGQLGEYETCVDYARRAVRLRQTSLPEGHSQTAYAASRLGICLAERGHLVEAEQVLKESLFNMQQAADPNIGWITETQQRLRRLEALKARPL